MLRCLARPMGAGSTILKAHIACCTHRPLLPFCVAITTATFPESRLSYAPFFRAMLCARAAAGGLRCVHGREAKGHDARRGA